MSLLGANAEASKLGEAPATFRKQWLLELYIEGERDRESDTAREMSPLCISTGGGTDGVCVL